MEGNNTKYKKCHENCTCTAKSIVKPEVTPKKYKGKTKQVHGKQFCVIVCSLQCLQVMVWLCSVQICSESKYN